MFMPLCIDVLHSLTSGQFWLMPAARRFPDIMNVCLLRRPNGSYPVDGGRQDRHSVSIVRGALLTEYYSSPTDWAQLVCRCEQRCMLQSMKLYYLCS